MCTGAEVGLLVTAAAGAYSATRKPPKTGNKPPPEVDPEAQREEVRKRAARARTRARGGYGQSDTLEGMVPAMTGGSGGKTLLGA